MLECYSSKNLNAIPLLLIEQSGYSEWLEQQPENIKNLLGLKRFSAKMGEFAVLPDVSGKIQKVIVGYQQEQNKSEILGRLALSLPEAIYELKDGDETGLLSLGWALGAYQFTHYKAERQKVAQLLLGKEQDFIYDWAKAIYQVRDLINTPAEDMQPEHLATVMQTLAKEYKADFNQIVGDELLSDKLNAIHAVGRAGAQKPRLLELRWGDTSAPKVTLIGKGVCFDSGGLDLKPTAGMRLMKKDMAGAAHIIGLAQYIMSQQLNIRLRLLIPAVENAIGPNALRPGDIISMYSGKSVEVDNTDAEGRLILADALACACEESPELLIDFATLTGGLATGMEVAAYFTNQTKIAEKLSKASVEVEDPAWQLPLHRSYLNTLKTSFADIKNSANVPGGTIIAAIFLQEFVAKEIPWVHFDIVAWNRSTRTSHPEGGEAMGIRTVFKLIEELANDRR